MALFLKLILLYMLSRTIGDSFDISTGYVYFSLAFIYIFSFNGNPKFHTVPAVNCPDLERT